VKFHTLSFKSEHYAEKLKILIRKEKMVNANWELFLFFRDCTFYLFNVFCSKQLHGFHVKVVIVYFAVIRLYLLKVGRSIVRMK